MRVCIGSFDGSSLYCCTNDCSADALTNDALCILTSARINYTVGTIGASNPFFKAIFPYFWADQKLTLQSPDPKSLLALLSQLTPDPLTGTVQIGDFAVPKKIRVVIYDDACLKYLDGQFLITDVRLSQRGGDLPQISISLTKA